MTTWPFLFSLCCLTFCIIYRIYWYLVVFGGSSSPYYQLTLLNFRITIILLVEKTQSLDWYIHELLLDLIWLLLNLICQFIETRVYQFQWQKESVRHFVRDYFTSAWAEACQSAFYTSEWPPCLKENLTQAYGLDTQGPGSLFAGGGWKLTITLALEENNRTNTMTNKNRLILSN